MIFSSKQNIIEISESFKNSWANYLVSYVWLNNDWFLWGIMNLKNWEIYQTEKDIDIFFEYNTLTDKQMDKFEKDSQSLPQWEPWQVRVVLIY